MKRTTVGLIAGLTLGALGVGGFVAFRVVQFVRYMQREGGIPRPGEQAFRDANRRIFVNSGTVAFGNTPEAVELARAYSQAQASLRRTGFEGGKQSAFAAAKGEFLTYCQLREDACVFLVHVPEMRQYSGDARDALQKLSWQAARQLLRGQDLQLVVALRGAVLYDTLLIGKASGDPTSYDSPMRDLPRLYPFFTSALPGSVPPPSQLESRPGAHASFADPGHLLLGKWINETAGLHTEVVFLEDSAFRGVSEKDGGSWRFSGKWTIASGALVWNYLDSTLAIPADRKVDTNRVLRLDESQLVLQEMDGSTTNWRKVP